MIALSPGFEFAEVWGSTQQPGGEPSAPTVAGKLKARSGLVLSFQSPVHVFSPAVQFQFTKRGGMVNAHRSQEPRERGNRVAAKSDI